MRPAHRSFLSIILTNISGLVQSGSSGPSVANPALMQWLSAWRTYIRPAHCSFFCIILKRMAGQVHSGSCGSSVATPTLMVKLSARRT